MDANGIEQRLLSEVRAARGKEVFTGDSAIDLFLLIRDGAQRMVAEGATGEKDVARAAENLRRFLGDMETERDRLGLSEFHERTVSKARQVLCPGLWPFC